MPVYKKQDVNDKTADQLVYYQLFQKYLKNSN